MGNRTSRPRLTDEAELAMFNSSLEDIQSRFATLLISVRTALEANHYSTSDVHTILVGMFTGSDDYLPNTNLEEIFRAATRHRLWDYLHHSPVENLLHRCLPDHISLIREYKEHLSGYCTTTKLINYIKYTNINLQQGHNKLPLGSYTREQCEKITVTLGLMRNITDLSLKYVQDLWERFAEEFRIPFLTAVIDSVLSGSLIITWLVPRDVAEKIIASAHKSTSFFQAHDIVSVTSTINIHVYSSKSQLALRDQLFAAALGNKEGYKTVLEQEMAIRSKVEEEMNSKIKDLEHKLERLESRMRTVPAPAAAAFAQGSPSKYYESRLSEFHHSVLYQRLSSYSTGWREIGIHLGFMQSELDDIQARPLLYATAPRSWLSALLSQWLLWAPGDARGSRGFATLEDLQHALKDAGLGTAAYDLHLYIE